VLDILEPLQAALNGSGPALLLYARSLDQRSTSQRSTSPHPSLGPDQPLGPDEDDEADPTAVVAATSGSTGAPKGALLPASALLASASATHDRLGGSGTWLLALPVEHVAGIQVLVRSLIARRDPIPMDLAAGFTTEAFAKAATRMPSGRHYTALVPTQLARILDDPQAAEALREFDAVLVGGARLVAPLRAAAQSARIGVTSTYGMSETCGGCVYDGVPLDGVLVSDESSSGRLRIGGPVVARGYRLRPGDASFAGEPSLAGDGHTRWFTTGDLGSVERTAAGQRVQILGRADDVIITGGLKIAASEVEGVLAQQAGVGEVVVVGVQDPDWGEAVVAVVEATSTGVRPDPLALRAAVADALGRTAAPKAVLVVDELPRIGPGKPDRRAAADLARSALAERPQPTAR
jgi:O-succinylbenzoic acid--CoA ligase